MSEDHTWKQDVGKDLHGAEVRIELPINAVSFFTVS
jgi:hypothetical protein